MDVHAIPPARDSNHVATCCGAAGSAGEATATANESGIVRSSRRSCFGILRVRGDNTLSVRTPVWRTQIH